MALFDLENLHFRTNYRLYNNKYYYIYNPNKFRIGPLFQFRMRNQKV